MKEPLAFRMRPTSLDDVIGQKELVGENGFLRKSVLKKAPFSMILFGPPGTGKTTIAIAYAKSMGIHYEMINAVTTDKKEMMGAIEDAKLFGHALIIVDEVHRLDKTKQDLLLPYVENGTFFLLGATTANPYVALNRAIRSRCRIFGIEPLSVSEVKEGLEKALLSPLGLNGSIKVEDEGLEYIAKLSGGDLRFGLNMLEQADILANPGDTVTLKELEGIERVPNIAMDKNDEEHYDSVSALQKSIRGADVDAALYYLARLCVAGDLDSIKRRLLVTAYEDIGLANPNCVMRTQLAIEAAEQVGFPEAIIPLGDVVVDLCLSPHSKAGCKSIQKAVALAESTPFMVKDYLRLTPINIKDEDRYPYERPDLWNKIEYLPEPYKDTSFFMMNQDSISNYEKQLNEQYLKLKKMKRTSNLRDLIDGKIR